MHARLFIAVYSHFFIMWCDGTGGRLWTGILQLASSLAGPDKLFTHTILFAKQYKLALANGSGTLKLRR